MIEILIRRVINNKIFSLQKTSKDINNIIKTILLKLFGHFKIMTNYIDRLKAKLKIKKFDPDQPINAWLFVLILNIVGFAGYFYLKINDIHLGD